MAGPDTSGGATARGLALATVVLVIVGVARSAERQRDWRDEATFETASARDSPRSWRTQWAYGQLLFTVGDRDQGLRAYQRALALVPPAHAWRVRNDLARRFWELGANDRPLEQLQASLAETPDKAETRYYPILAYLTVGAYADARREADAALARGLSPKTFGELRAVADRAIQVGAPPGSLRIRVGSGAHPPWSAAPSLPDLARAAHRRRPGVRALVGADEARAGRGRLAVHEIDPERDAGHGEDERPRHRLAEQEPARDEPEQRRPERERVEVRRRISREHPEPREVAREGDHDDLVEDRGRRSGRRAA